MTIENPTCSFDDKLESFLDKEEMGDKIFQNYELGIKGFLDRNGEESRESSSSSDFLASELAINDKHSSTEDPFSPTSKICPIQKVEDVKTPNLDKNKFEKKEIEMMKKKFAKLLLGEDMSGCGNGVSTALATSNAITNLCATLFGQIWRLEPLPLSKKLRWRREIEWFLCVSNHIVELTPCLQTFPDGSEQEVMTSRARSDLYVNLPALRKLDTMLLEILDSFENTEFWYVDKGSLAPEEDGSSSFRKPLPHEEEKWWLPVPRVSASGLSKDARKQLQHRCDCTKQILKAAMAINSITLADMEVPESYLEALPKNVKASLGDLIYGYINADQFSPECLLDCLHLTSEKQAFKVANRVEASIHIWRQRASKTLNIENQSNSKSSWEMVKDLVVDADKSEILADRAEGLLLCLKQNFPCLSQTTLDMSKIKFNTDIGKSILESYSRVLKSLAFNIISRIDDLLYVDDLTRHSDQSASISKVVTRAENNVKVMPISGTPNNTAFNTPSISPIRNTSPTKVERSSSILEQNKPYHEDYTRAENSIKIAPISSTPNNTAFTTPSISPIINTSPTKVQKSSSILEKHKPQHRGLGVKKSLTDYLSIDISNTKLKDSSSPSRKSESDSSTSRTNQESFTPQSVDSCEFLKDSASPSCMIHLGKNELENLVPLTITKAFTFVSDCF